MKGNTEVNVDQCKIWSHSIELVRVSDTGGAVVVWDCYSGISSVRGNTTERRTGLAGRRGCLYTIFGALSPIQVMFSSTDGPGRWPLILTF